MQKALRVITGRIGPRKLTRLLVLLFSLLLVSLPASAVEQPTLQGLDRATSVKNKSETVRVYDVQWVTISPDSAVTVDSASNITIDAGVMTETDPLALLTAGTDNVKDTHIDWGSGASQVNLADIPGGTAGASAFDFSGATSTTFSQLQSTQSGNTKLTLQASDTGASTNNDLMYFKAANVTDYLKIVNSASGLQLINNSGSWQIAASSNITLNAGYIYFSGNPFPGSDNSYDFGDADERFRDLFLSRKVSDGTNTITMGNPVVFSGNILSPKLIGGTATTSDLSLQTTSGVGEAGADMHFLVGSNGGTEAMTILNSGNVGIGTTSPTAYLHLKAGTATANTAPLKFTAGVLNTTPESGAMEWYADLLYITDSGATRREIYKQSGTDVAIADGGTGKSSWTQYLIPYADTTTSLSQIAIGTDGQVLTSGGAGVAPAFESPTVSAPTAVGDMLYSSDGSTWTRLAIGTNGQTLKVGWDSYAKLNSHFDGNDAATAYTDPIAGAYTFVGTAQLDTAQKKFGTASLLLDGNSDYVTLSDSTDWDFGSGDFTVDFQIRWNGSTANTDFIGQWSTGASLGWICRFYNNTLSFTYSTTGSNAIEPTFAWVPSIDTWYHIAFVRNGSNLYAFVNGSQVGSTADMTGATIYNGGGNLEVGFATQGLGTYFNGWIDEVRVSKGIARWTANFTPQTTAYEGVPAWTTV